MPRPRGLALRLVAHVRLRHANDGVRAEFHLTHSAGMPQQRASQDFVVRPSHRTLTTGSTRPNANVSRTASTSTEPQGRGRARCGQRTSPPGYLLHPVPREVSLQQGTSGTPPDSADLLGRWAKQSDDAARTSPSGSQRHWATNSSHVSGSTRETKPGPSDEGAKGRVQYSMPRRAVRVGTHR